MNKRREYIAQKRYDYIGIEEYSNENPVTRELDGKLHCQRTVITGIKPHSLGRTIAKLLQRVYEDGYQDATDNLLREAK